MGGYEMGEAKVKKMNQGKTTPLSEPERFHVIVALVDGSVEEYEDVVQFGPIPNRDLLGITSFDGVTEVYPLTGNIRKYRFHKIK
jgi:hypothetical protein